MKSKITKKFLQELEDLIQYVWEDEEANWDESGRPAEGHIFVAIKSLNDWLAEAEAE